MKQYFDKAEDSGKEGLEEDEVGIRVMVMAIEMAMEMRAGEMGMEMRMEMDVLWLCALASTECLQFVRLLSKVLKKNAANSRQELTHLFMKIDANSDGSVDWDEFTNFLLMENTSSAEMEYAYVGGTSLAITIAITITITITTHIPIPIPIPIPISTLVCDRHLHRHHHLQ